MIERAYEKNYVALVKILIGIKNKIDEIETNTAPEIIEQKNIMIRDVKNMIDQLAVDLHELLCFSYELRKQDNPDDMYTHAFLDDLKLNEMPFTQTLYYQIIMSNYYLHDTGQMKVREDVMFRLQTGRDYQYHLRCEVTNGKSETPFVVRPVDVEAVMKHYHEMQGKSAIKKFFDALSKLPNKVNEFMRIKYCEG